MAEDIVGYGNPPRHTQFTKGQSGNPGGRPKGSQNLATVMDKIMRQRVKVTENGRERHLTKGEAMFLQLWNKALRGDVTAIHELRYWVQFFMDVARPSSHPTISHEADHAVLARALERIRKSEALPLDSDTDSADTESKEGSK
jgi:hypothetical protein